MFERQTGKGVLFAGLLYLVVGGCGGQSSSGDSEDTTVDSAGSGDAAESGDASTDTAPTVIAKHLEVIEEGGSPSGGAVSGVTKTEFASDSDFAQTDTLQYVQTPARNATQQINYYMCLMQQMRPGAMAGKGAYLAIVNEKPCESHPVPEKDILPFVVQVTENSGDYRIKFWNKRGDSRYLGQAEVTELPSDANPNGRFSLKWQKQNLNNGAWEDGEQGIIQPYTTANGRKAFKWFEDDYEDYAGHLIFPGNSQPGQLRLKIAYPTSDDISSGLEYNDHYVHVLSKTVASDGTQNTQLNQCQDRTDPTYVNWGYHLFAKADGTAVSINTGFPFKHNGQFGWVGYWGVSYESTDDIVGGTITRLQDGSGKGGQTYTLDESASGSNTDSGISFGLRDSNGDLVDFQAPKGLTYTVQEADEINGDPNNLAGTKIDLAYSGGDQLTFPTMTNYDWSAGTAQLNLKAGTVVKGYSGKEFVLKPTDQAITLEPVSSCMGVDGQTAIDNLSLPTSELLKAVGLSWSDKPSTPDTPSVIEGKLQ